MTHFSRSDVAFDSRFFSVWMMHKGPFTPSMSINTAIMLEFCSHWKQYSRLKMGFKPILEWLHCFQWEQNCNCHHSIDADAWHKWALIVYISVGVNALFALTETDPETHMWWCGGDHTALNSFGLLTFDKTVILEVSGMGTINLALRPDVYCIIFQSLEVLSRLKACFFYAMDAWPL